LAALRLILWPYVSDSWAEYQRRSQESSGEALDHRLSALDMSGQAKLPSSEKIQLHEANADIDPGSPDMDSTILPAAKRNAAKDALAKNAEEQV